MKLMYCKDCGDIIAPHSDPEYMRFCRCRQSVCFWDNPRTGDFAVWNEKQNAMVIGLHNGLLGYTFMDIHTVDEILKDTPENYLFKTFRSLVVIIYPGMSGDTRFATWDECKTKKWHSNH